MKTPLYIDTHAHLFLSYYSNNIDDVIRRAKNIGVEYIVVPGTDLNSSREAVQLSEKHENIYACIGIHPHEAEKAAKNDLLEIEKLSDHPKVVAIGEIGLDYHYDFSPRDKQRMLFSNQIDIAIKRNLPIVVHTRKSTEDAFSIVNNAIKNNSNWKISHTTPKRGVFHCFPGTIAEAKYLYELGFYVSFPGIVTFKKSDRVDVIKQIGLKCLFLETDSPYMTPEPFRGSQNEPANIVYIGKKIAEELGISESEVARTTSENAINLFGLK